MAILKTDYKDDILDTSQNTKRKYAMSENQDDTVSFDDETEYLQEGDSFGAQDINATNAQVNTNTGAIADINDNLSGFKFYPTGTQLVAYIEGHGWYNADGKYVIWGTATANALVEASPNTYYGRQSEEDLRGEVGADTGVPFKSGGNLKDYGFGNSTSNQNKNITLASAKVGDIITAFGSIYSYGYSGGAISCTNAELLEEFEVSNAGITYKTCLKVSVFKVTALNPILTIKLNTSSGTSSQVTTFQYGYTIT